MQLFEIALAGIAVVVGLIVMVYQLYYFKDRWSGENSDSAHPGGNFAP